MIRPMILDLARTLLPPSLRTTLSRALGHDRIPRPRRYIPAGVSVESFFAALDQAGVQCAVLRWFDTLPQVEPGEDIDMLVADKDLPALAAHLDSVSGAVPCDIYTVGGLAGTQFKGQAYYPAALASATIARRVIVNGGYPAPCPQDHFDGLAYHAVYQKGPASGLPTGTADIAPLAAPEHDYLGVLSRLRDDLNLDVAIELPALDAYLAAKGYRPSPGLLQVLAKSNPWVAHYAFR